MTCITGAALLGARAVPVWGTWRSDSPGAGASPARARAAECTRTRSTRTFP